MPIRRIKTRVIAWVRPAQSYLLVLSALLLAAAPALAQTRPDRPVDTHVNELDRQIAPAVKQARATLPQTKRRYLAGLPAGTTLYVTTRVSDPGGDPQEQVFVKVTQWRGTIIKGVLGNDLQAVRTFRRGQAVTVPEANVLDWTLTGPGGREEGNYVGKLLEASAK